MQKRKKNHKKVQHCGSWVIVYWASSDKAFYTSTHFVLWQSCRATAIALGSPTEDNTLVQADTRSYLGSSRRHHYLECSFPSSLKMCMPILANLCPSSFLSFFFFLFFWSGVGGSNPLIYNAWVISLSHLYLGIKSVCNKLVLSF